MNQANFPTPWAQSDRAQGLLTKPGGRKTYHKSAVENLISTLSHYFLVLKIFPRIAPAVSQRAPGGHFLSPRRSKKVRRTTRNKRQRERRKKIGERCRSERSSTLSRRFKDRVKEKESNNSQVGAPCIIIPLFSYFLSVLLFLHFLIVKFFTPFFSLQLCYRWSPMWGVGVINGLSL